MNLAFAPDPAPLPRDPLSEILQDFRLVGVGYGRCELRAPWGIKFPAQTAARFHFVADGPCFFHTEGQGWIELVPGDIVFLPKGSPHAIASAPDLPCKPIDPAAVKPVGGVFYHLTDTGDGPASTLFCGSMVVDSPALHPLLDLMPDALRGCEVAARDPLVLPLLHAMGTEVRTPQCGGATMLTRLADLLAARLIRAWMATECASTQGWVAAVRDPQIGRALVAIHTNPGQDWTLADLARVAGLSRSVFADRFSRAVGEGPGRYLARWRMQLASDWLGRDRLPIAQVAQRLGYESEASFSRAFKRLTGTSPGQLRRVRGENAGRMII